MAEAVVLLNRIILKLLSKTCLSLSLHGGGEQRAMS